MNGTLYGVGVGPGAPDLLTLRAVNVLRAVDVILAAASPRNDYSAALDTARPHLRPDARLLRLEFPMTRDAGVLREAWLKAAQAAREVLEGGESAAFLTIGDPLIYSTFGYLLRALREIAAKEPAFRCRIYRFGEKFMVSPFSSDDAEPCKQFIGSHAEHFPGMWTYTAR